MGFPFKPMIDSSIKGDTSTPGNLVVEANYGLPALKEGNRDHAAQFAFYILSPAGQKILADHGFDFPLSPPM
ncbi:MAG: hypothetical protein M3O26_14980 [Pseudomonadota bacterium]|nr:hypothetical protein [Pseudomonadota bacterium]